MMSTAIETAIKMETDAMKFYRDAALRTSHPFGKKMFEGFIKDEERHLKMLKDILDGLDIHDPMVRPKEEIKTVFSEIKDQMMKRVTASTDELEAVKVALDFESKGYAFYRDAAAHASDEKEKALLLRLAQEEQEHHSILENTFAFMKNTGDWFMWEEHGILEG